MNFKAIHLWNSWSLHPHIHACSSVHRMFHLKADYVVFPWQVSERVSLLVSLLVDLLSIFCKPALLPRCKHNPEYERLTGWVFFFLSKGEKKKKVFADYGCNERGVRHLQNQTMEGETPGKRSRYPTGCFTFFRASKCVDRQTLCS